MCVTSGELTVNSPAGVITELSPLNTDTESSDSEAEENTEQLTGSDSDSETSE